MSDKCPSCGGEIRELYRKTEGDDYIGDDDYIIHGYYCPACKKWFEKKLIEVNPR